MMYSVHEYGWSEGARIVREGGAVVMDGVRPIKLAHRIAAALNHAYALGHRHGTAEAREAHEAHEAHEPKSVMPGRSGPL